MVISAVSSGLGNQLFQYAMGRRLAAKHGVPLKLDLSWFQTSTDLPGLNMFRRNYRLHAFNTVAEEADPDEIVRSLPKQLGTFDLRRMRGSLRRVLRCTFPALCRGMRIYERDANFEAGLLSLPDNVYLQGWWQSESYFQDHATLIRSEFNLRDRRIVERATAYVDTQRHDSRQLVAVQVRRGDVARAHEVLKDLTHMPYELASKEYLQSAMAIFGDEATFLVFSETEEDMAWCRANLRARYIHFARGESDLDDFAAMSRCDHNIISNSSFGWWAAWLNPNPNKTVVAPHRWFRKEYAPRYDIHSLIPAAWQII